MNTSRIRLRLKKRNVPTVQILKPGDAIEAGDIVVNDCFVESPSESTVGNPADERDVIVRLVFQ